MTTARCEQCQQRLRLTPEGVACGCQQMSSEAVERFLAAFRCILSCLPDPWPIPDFLEFLGDRTDPR